MADIADDHPASPDTKASLNTLTPVRGMFERPRDVDWYAFRIERGYSHVLLSLQGDEAPSYSAQHYALAVYDAWGQVVARQMAGSYGFYPMLEFVALNAGTYYVAAASLSDSSALGGYRLSAQWHDIVGDDAPGPWTPKRLAGDGTVAGSFEVAGDTDWVAFSVRPGMHYEFTVEGVGQPYMPPSEVAILDANYQPVPGLGWQWGFDPKAAGDYLLELRSLAAGGYKVRMLGWSDDYAASGEGTGSLAPGALAAGAIEYDRDVDRFRMQLEQDNYYTVTLKGEQQFYSLYLKDAAGATVAYYYGNTNTENMRFVFRAPADGEYFLDVAQLNSSVGGESLSYTVALGAGMHDLVGSSIAAAAPARAGTPVLGVLEAAGDLDTYRMSLAGGERYALTVGAQSGQREWLTLRVLAADGRTLAYDDGSDRNYSLALDFTPPASGEYYLQVGRTGFGSTPFTLLAQPLRGDTAGPALLASSHPNGAAGVRVTDNTVVLTFSEAVAIDKSKISIVDASGKAVAMATDADSSYASWPFVQGAQVFLKTADFLKPGSYTVQLPRAAVSDLAGNAYTGPDSLRFSTVALQDAGTPGDDLLAGGKGMRIDGGAGIDTLLLPGSAGSYQILREAGAVTVRQGLFGLPDVVSGVERLLFQNQAIALDIDGAGGQAYRLYRAAFDRAPDLKGVGYWMSRLDAGASLLDVARAFIGSLEFQSLYGSAPSDAEFVRLLYANVLHRAPDQGGLDYWMARLGEGHPREHLLKSFSESPENQDALADIIGNGFVYQPY
ncbi:DUF4214 domain-containing protein [Massilia sp. IC2-476]|uniref:DUF4214 domain-containing protein n=1 Tax=Massilia sp. IC2-476 TaxID=2887199 RepID=UPI001D123D31|nr:DUF4214 domain-containing protein [Massilia sp. IC2-476]MCC2973114.1 DUF4214 domain-containing protein [Massilia sp. IC2-476]